MLLYFVITFRIAVNGTLERKPGVEIAVASAQCHWLVVLGLLLAMRRSVFEVRTLRY